MESFELFHVNLSLPENKKSNKKKKTQHNSKEYKMLTDSMFICLLLPPHPCSWNASDRAKMLDTLITLISPTPSGLVDSECSNLCGIGQVRDVDCRATLKE